MKYVLLVLFIGALSAFIACSSASQSEQQSPVSEPNPKPVEDKDPQVMAIDREVGQIKEKMTRNRLQEIAFEIDEGGGFIAYKRLMEGELLRFITVAYCSDHGCERISYYFSEGQLILKLVENSHWVGNTDKIEEKRRYFDRQQEIFCAERSAEGEGGYDVVLNKLETFQLAEVKCGEPFDVSGIEGLKTLTEENAADYFDQ